ncbi:hypothetical protein ACFWA9_38415 [Kitasatospora sp. NPDC059973]|uniref:hypothetical protein n=1 Tax=Kitasatospora sp. NPDC059973 TaxID=3347020 RepID=UPI0036838625
MSVDQRAAMKLTAAGSEVVARWREDPRQAVALVQGLAASGEVGVDEVLDAAMDEAVLVGLLALQGVRTTRDPSTAAERCLGAVAHISLAITLASADLD